jgi:lipopolysaccharide transport system permease protein
VRKASNMDNSYYTKITPVNKRFALNIREIIEYRDLLVLFVRRDIVSVYKQTVLGPLWFFIQPLFTSITQLVVFGMLARIPSDGVPYFLFALTGNTLWGYFSSSMNGVANTFSANQGIFGKVYFPRAIMPIAITLSNLFKFGIQYVLFLVVWLYLWLSGSAIEPNWFVLLTPLLLIAMALISMGLGMVITSLTTKYRDFTFLLGFGVTLFMYITPVVYPTSLFLERFPAKWHWLIYANPLTGIFDVFRYGYLGSGTINTMATLWSFAFSILIYLFGLMIFNKTERSFMDTI